MTKTDSISSTTKMCSSCYVYKPLSDFYVEKRSGKEYANCKQCRKDAARAYRDNLSPETRLDRFLRSSYGITLDEYNAILVKQGGVCAICGKATKRRLYVDHDHKTGAFRGLLCNNCNLALGHIDDNISVLEQMIAYLEES